ncbi:hypothetical protein BGZ83_001936 [Gryganskiella cystojenkinii]|nr:hypothetical protein BGZ83_001936 [Gryganskiella cystojenkinii]
MIQGGGMYRDELQAMEEFEQMLLQQTRLRQVLGQPGTLQEQEHFKRVAENFERMKSEVATKMLDGVNETIKVFVENMVDNTLANEARKRQIEDVRKRLKGVLARGLGHQDIDVLLYGSNYTGLATMETIADFILMDRRDTSKYSVRNIEKILKAAGYEILFVFDDVRVPVVTFNDPRTQITCEVCVNEPLRLEKSKLIKTYVQIDDRFLPVFFALRYMTNLHGILGEHRLFLSTYSLTLMLISYFQLRKIFPSLQQQDPARMTPKTIVEGWDCSFDTNWRPYRGAAATADKSDFTQLLRDFCTFHIYGFRYATYEANVRKGAYNLSGPRDVSDAKTEEEKKKLREAPICVTDPFERNRNVTSNIIAPNVEKIQSTFKFITGCFEGMDVESVFYTNEIDDFDDYYE